jgi:hypothetical protein
MTQKPKTTNGLQPLISQAARRPHAAAAMRGVPKAIVIGTCNHSPLP